MLKLQAIDDSNRGVHHYLTPEDECYFLHEYTARKNYQFSVSNQFIYNFKKLTSQRNQAHYQYKLKAIASAIGWYRDIFDQIDSAYTDCTFVPIPPSKVPGHPEYDDRMWQVVSGVCNGKGADARELIRQSSNYDAAHLAENGTRIKPHELQPLYQVDPNPPKGTILLFDDVLSAGTHYKAAKGAILAVHPGIQVVGIFLARRVLPDPAADFDVIEF